MKRAAFTLLWTCLALTALGAPLLAADQQSGTLVFDVKRYTSDAKIPKKSQKALEHAGIQWGMLDNSLVITFVSLRFVKADLPYMTRFGEQRTLQLKPGQYTITCIGYVFSSTSSDVDKTLSKSAFFNNDVLTFTVLPSKTTTLEVFPVYEAQSNWRFLTKVTLFIPDLNVKVWEDGIQKGESVINRRTDKSVSWDDYHGPLKF
jgi:hypothetical protein